MLFGVHVSIQGSICEAPRRAAALGCDCFQIFAGPPRNRRRRMPPRAEAERFRSLVAELGLGPVAVHAGYLVHLVSAKRRVAKSSRSLLRKELAIASRLGADHYVIHPGSRGGSGGRERRALLEELAGVLATAAEGHAGAGPAILIENTASARSGLCARFEHLAELLALVEARGGGGSEKARFGVCLDTAHAVAAGYDMATPDGVASTLRALYGAVGRSRVELVHANDSREPVGSSRDRHEHVGRGHLGRKGFRAFLSDRTMRRLPFILETPLDREGDDRRNLAAIRRIAREAEGPAGTRAGKSGKAGRRRG